MKKIQLNDDIIAKIISLFNDHKNLTQIQCETKIGRRVIEKLLVSLNLSIKTKSEIIIDQMPILKDKVVLSKMYHEDKLSIDEIAQQLKTNSQVIKTAFKQHKIKPRNNKTARLTTIRKQYPLLSDYHFLYKEYIELKKSPQVIALLVGCSSRAIETALDEHKIKRRNFTESLRRSTPEQQLNAKIARNLRTRLWIALEGKSKMTSAVRDLGCSIEAFRLYLETLFHPNSKTGELMTWNNYGNNGWELDHTEPLSSYDLSFEQSQKDACHYSNIKPMWRAVNRSKSNKILGAQPTRVPMYIICGPAGVGKSWVCDQLKNVNYISYDTIPKEQHYHYMVELSKNGQPIVYDPFRKVTTLKRRYEHLFDIQIIYIQETVDIIFNRLKSRGSNLSLTEVQDHCSKMNKYTKHAQFIGTSQEVLNYLNQSIAS